MPVTLTSSICFQLLENHIKNEIIENSQLVRAQIDQGNKQQVSEPRRSASIACGAAVFEVCMKLPLWASQVLFYVIFFNSLYL